MKSKTDCQDCGETHEDPSSVEDLEKIQKDLKFRFRLFVAGFVFSVLGSIASAALINPAAGLLISFLYSMAFFHLNLTAAGDGEFQVSLLLKHKKQESTSNGDATGQYL